MNGVAMGRLLPVLLAAMFFYPAAHATNVALTGDAHVSLTRSTTNFGTLANLYVGNGNTALLQFDLSTLPAGLTSSQVAHATLTVFVNRVNTGGTVSLSPVTSAWSESAVTYATIPTIGAPVDGIFSGDRRTIRHAGCDFAGAGLGDCASHELWPRSDFYGG